MKEKERGKDTMRQIRGNKVKKVEGKQSWY